MTTHPDHAEFDVTGMTCAACAARVEKVLSRVPGVEKAQVNLALERAAIDFTGDASPEALVAAIEKAGYGAQLRVSDMARQREADEALAARRRAEERQTLLRTLVSAALSIPLVIGTAPAMLGLGETLIGPWTQAGLAAGVMAVSGTRFYREAFAAVRGGGANMAVLVSIGTTVAFAWSLWQVLAGHGHGHLYFEAAAVVLTLVMLGKYLEARARQGASSALAALGKLQPRSAERIGPDGPETVAAEDLRPGDRVLVRPGKQMPCDGTIRSGATSVDESLVTGESLPVERQPGDPVITGTVNGSGAVEVEVTAVGADTRLARMTKLVEEAQQGNAPIQRLVDRISAVFVPVILVAAALTFLGWWLIAGDAEGGLVAAVSVLVIACPCALGLATPTALAAGTGAAARAGILIRDIETLETAGHVGAIAFDKTGTLTLGKPQVSAIEPADVARTDINAAELLTLAASLEASSEHPLAEALVIKAKAANLALKPASGVTARAGQGLIGTVDGRRVAVGNMRLMAAEGIGEAAAQDLFAALPAAGTTAGVAVDGQLAGAIAFSDLPRKEAAEAVARLRKTGLEAVMLTGDNEAAARRVAGEIGIDDVRAALAPEEKVAAVRAMDTNRKGGVAFVGDGLNDGPALAAAKLGIALSSGTDVAREAAAITLMRPDLTLVPAALDIAAKTKRTITQNLVWAFVYNVIGIPLAALGILSPVFAGAAMAFSSVSVVTNSALLARWKPRGKR
ncbi:copper-translocating P-type ATPase [Zhengella mangrovi]|uniref:P-type Cu(2+) transporter n=1 Tax=Zhengella mangrovi TaxID=1982044 RepID=A0A2G1QP56_9HYPH|nr:heavy metal translocating P-type ATPase [Zhengella mangrovi]PHP67303.1 copper-translocating P-type ATPase [Zhengella mangrovi]